ncbi:MAG: bifunctional phosphoglucose/phosphomannose isomerase [Patescibacteria group bacterium]|nr:bifunctional phosphoglucose/phosphomannose isomerase [Patescibacteria group bacterium]
MTKTNPTINLTSRQEIAKLDVGNALGSVEALAKQIEHAWADVKNVQVLVKTPIEKVVVSGMGGSGLGAHVIKALFKEELKVPFDFVNSYTLPAYVDAKTLVILSSYSGTTEEVLASAKEAAAKNAQIVAITTGGDLAQLAKQRGWPIYMIDPVHNPSGQPRMAIGYSVFGTIGLCAQAGLLSLSNIEVQSVQTIIKQQLAKSSVEVEADSNPAKLLAYEMVDRRPIIVVAEFLEGMAHVNANQLNENAKIFADYKIVPEINHHLMEGLRFPLTNKDTHAFIFVNSELYLPKNQKRMAITKQIVEKNGLDTMRVELTAKTKLGQACEMLALFSFVSFYLSMLEGIDPSPVPFVDEFKQELKK